MHGVACVGWVERVEAHSPLNSDEVLEGDLVRIVNEDRPKALEIRGKRRLRPSLAFVYWVTAWDEILQYRQVVGNGVDLHPAQG